MLLRAGWSRALPYAVSLAWVAFFAVLQWSVVRFKVPIVVVLTLSALALAAWQWRRPAVPPATRRSISLALLGSAVALAWVPSFTYLDAGARRWGLGAFVVGAVLAAVLVLKPGPAAGWLTLGAGVTAYLVGSVVAIVGDPAPRIDVWVTLQQASDGLLHGQNMYAMTWTGSPGIRDAFTYLPWTAVLLAPGRWLAGDVRWALVFWTLVAAVGVWALAHGTGAAALVRPLSRRRGGDRGASSGGDRGTSSGGGTQAVEATTVGSPHTGPGAAWRGA